MDDLSTRVFRWYKAGYNLTRILLHPDDMDQAKKLWPSFTYEGLPIEFL